jgi:hypothetical protein
VCRHYLSNGRREGRYWLVGDVRNTPGRSMFVRLKGPESGRGAAGKWTDAATGEHGDLLDVIRESCRLLDFHAVTDEGRHFLSLPRFDPEPARKSNRSHVQTGSPEAARRLFAMSQPIARTLVEAYLRNRGITALHEAGSLRFHPRCYYRPDEDAPAETWPAMIAGVTDLDGRITGAHRTWLDPSGRRKAPIDTPRRAMGDLLGNAVRFGVANDVLAAGEGIETMLSLRCVLPTLPMAAALSANHLGAMLLPLTLSPALYRPRRRCGRRGGGDGPDRAGRGGRHRGNRIVATTRRLQRGPTHARHRRTPDRPAQPARAPQDVVRFMLWATAKTG